MIRTTWLLFAVLSLAQILTAKDMMRKSIVFDKNTPDVFYCPLHKPSGFDKLIVKAQPLKKLCEFEGKPIPEDYKSDCYQDVDESDYACKEKYRIMMRMHPPGSEEPFSSPRLARFIDVDKQYYVMKLDNNNNKSNHKKTVIKRTRRVKPKTFLTSRISRV